jgi:hypothetical protein
MLWVVVILALLAAVMGMVLFQVRTGIRQLDQRQNRLQAEWLARAGLDLAAARLLDQPTGYSGESLELMPHAQVHVEVKGRPGAPDVFEVTSIAHYPIEDRATVVRTETRHFRRTIDKGRVRLEVVATNAQPRSKVGS